MESVKKSGAYASQDVIERDEGTEQIPKVSPDGLKDESTLEALNH